MKGTIMSYEALKWLHLTFIFLLMMSLGGVAFYFWSGGELKNFKLRKAMGALHGISVTVILITGILLVRHLFPEQAWPVWTHIKLGIWILLSSVIGLFYRKSKLANILFWACLALASTAAALATHLVNF